jgi:hypothetical protein
MSGECLFSSLVNSNTAHFSRKLLQFELRHGDDHRNLNKLAFVASERLDENEKFRPVARFRNQSGGGDRHRTFASARLYAAGISRRQESGHHCALDGLAI